MNYESPSVPSMGVMTRSHYDDHRGYDHAMRNQEVASHSMGHCPQGPPQMGQGAYMDRADGLMRDVQAENSLRGFGPDPSQATCGQGGSQHYDSQAYAQGQMGPQEGAGVDMAPTGTRACKSSNHVYQYNGRPQDPLQRFFQQPSWVEPIGTNLARMGLGMDTRQAAKDKLEIQHKARRNAERCRAAHERRQMAAAPFTFSTNQ